jgi:hypothetical protein
MYPQFVKKHVSLSCNFPLRKYNVFSTRNTPTNYEGTLEKMQHSCVKKRNLLPNDMVSPAAEKPKAKVLLRYLCVSLQRLLIIASVGFFVCAFFKAGVDSAVSP